MSGSDLAVSAGSTSKVLWAGLVAGTNYLVVPLSAWHVVPHFTRSRLLENIVAMVLFGLIVASFLSPRSSAPDQPVPAKSG
jgi:DMSO reductase anchor subunit